MLGTGRIQVSRSFRFPSGVSLTSLSWAPSSLNLRKCRMSYLVNSGGVTEKITWASASLLWDRPKERSSVLCLYAILFQGRARKGERYKD